MSQLNLVVMLHSLFVALSSSKSELVLPVTNSTFPLHAIWQDFRNIWFLYNFAYAVRNEPYSVNDNTHLKKTKVFTTGYDDV
jgi:hypothetical protein